tara:strand:+ start:15893 stop:16615 length:723 start_codon:yes stop_codon:yes gene_type:complete
MSKSLDHSKVFLITGTSRGVGKYLAEYYTGLGHHVIGCSRGESDIEAGNYKHYKVDISDEKNIRLIFSHIRKEHKTVDVVINNAVRNPANISSALLNYKSIEETFRVNLFSTMIICREAVKLMVRAKSGRIINIGSMVTKSNHEEFGGSLYTPSKAALNSYSRVLAKEVYRSGITVNVVAPSALETDLAEKSDQNELMKALSRNAIKEFGKMEDVSNMIDFLIKEDSSALTGQIYYLGGV